MIAKVKKYMRPGKEVFWIWVTYQAVKGILTTTLIWVPALMLWLK
jgi:hypothetical protein